MPVIISLDDSDSDEQDVFSARIRAKLIEESPFDGEEWNSMTEATKLDCRNRGSYFPYLIN
jgi:hypothetical protein